MASKGSILIVEDQPGFRRIYEDVLADAGYEVLVAEDGEKGWRTAVEKVPNLILLDLGLPKMDGFEVLRRVREDPKGKDIPIIIFSVMGEEKDIKKALDMGANDYTIKGFYTPRQILSKVKGLVQARELPAENSAFFKLEVQAGTRDGASIGRIIGLKDGGLCPACGIGAVLEMYPDQAQGGEHWFRGRWVCPQCSRVF